MVSEFLVEEVDLVVQHLYAYQHGSLLLSAAAEGLHFARFRVFLVDMFVIVIGLVVVNLIEEEREQHQVVVEVLK